MRTTVDLDPPLLRALRDRAHRAGLSFKEMINRTIRRGLDQETRQSPAGPYQCPSYPMGLPAAGIDLDKALAVAAALEDDEISRELTVER